MGLFSRTRRPHLQVVEDIPPTVEPAPQTHGEAIGALVDQMIEAQARVIAAQGDLHRLQLAHQETEQRVLEAIDKLNLSERSISAYASKKVKT